MGIFGETFFEVLSDFKILGVLAFFGTLLWYPIVTQ
jgi:hypothetical protein